MKLENQLCTLEQGYLLKELGVSQTSVFFKHPNWNNPKTGSELYDVYGIDFKADSIALFSVAELGRFIGYQIDKIHPRFGGGFNIGFEHQATRGEGINHATGATNFTRHNIKTEAEARTILALYMIDCKFLSIEEINSRLNS